MASSARYKRKQPSEAAATMAPLPVALVELDFLDRTTGLLSALNKAFRVRLRQPQQQHQQAATSSAVDTGTTSSNIAHVILPGIKTLAFHFWQMGASAEDADTMLAVATQLQAKHKHSYFVIVAPPRASGTAAAPQAFDPDIMLQLQTKLPRGDMRLLLASDMIEAVRTIPKLLQSACAPDRRTQIDDYYKKLEGYHASRSFAVKLLQRQPSMKALENPGDIEHVLDVFGSLATVAQASVDDLTMNTPISSSDALKLSNFFHYNKLLL